MSKRKFWENKVNFQSVKDMFADDDIRAVMEFTNNELEYSDGLNYVFRRNFLKELVEKHPTEWAIAAFNCTEEEDVLATAVQTYLREWRKPCPPPQFPCNEPAPAPSQVSA